VITRQNIEMADIIYLPVIHVRFYEC